MKRTHGLDEREIELAKLLIAECHTTGDIQAKLKKLFAGTIEQMLEAEMDEHLGYEQNSIEGNNSGNSRNGYGKKTISSDYGECEIVVPRGRNGEFEPKVIEKRQTRTDEIEQKIMTMYVKGMLQRDIQDTLKEIYGTEISQGLISQITDKILPEVNEWQNRPLEAVYPIIFFDGIMFNSRKDNKIVTKCVYVVLGIQMDGRKDIPGVWIGENESAKFWLTVMNDLKNRGVKDVYVFCADGLTGFREAINAAFPKSRIQRCIIHQIRSSTRYVSYKDIKALMADLKKVYQAINEDEAMNALLDFKEKWQRTYPSCVKSWEDNRDILSTFFAYPAEVRKVIYTTNTIEGLNRQFRKITKNKPSFTSDDSLRRILYLASKNITSHWTVICRNWDLVSNQLSIMFADRETA